MNPIKVNITNFEQNRSSTTLNFVICRTVWQMTTSSDIVVAALETGTENAAIAASAQLYVNALAAFKLEKQGNKALNQHMIESDMMYHIRFGLSTKGRINPVG
jgi:allantoicase